MGTKLIEEIVCSGCQRTGHATWEVGLNSRRNLVDISAAFDYRSDDGDFDVMVVVCGHCGTVQPNQLARAN